MDKSEYAFGLPEVAWWAVVVYGSLDARRDSHTHSSMTASPGISRTTALGLLVLALLWGSEFLFVDVALRSVGPTLLVCVRLALAGGLLTAIARARGVSFPRSKVTYAHCAVLALAATLMPYFLMAWAQQRISSALTGILVGAGPLVTALLANAVLHHERLTRQRAIGLLVGFGGVVVVIAPWNADLGGDLFGCVAALGVACGFAVGYVYNVRFLTSSNVSGTAIMAVQSVFGSAAAGVALLAGASVHVDFEIKGIAALLCLGLVNTGLAAIVFFSLLRTAGAVVTSLVEYLMVIVAVVLGVGFLSERITTTAIAGMALILGGVAITERRTKSPDGLAIDASTTTGSSDS